MSTPVKRINAGPKIPKNHPILGDFEVFWSGPGPSKNHQKNTKNHQKSPLLFPFLTLLPLWQKGYLGR
jgi:hypothetical protein